MTGFSIRATKWNRALNLAKVLCCTYGLHQLASTTPRGPLRLDSRAVDVPRKQLPLIRKSKPRTFFAESESADYPQDFCSFVDSCPSTYHAVEAATRLLKDNAFQEIREDEQWYDTVRPGGKYFVIRDNVSGSSLIAFAVGELWRPGNPFAMIATHVDSPCLKIRSISDAEASKYSLLGVETYGGGLWHSWLDRDLSIAGRVYFYAGPDRRTIESRLIRIDEPVLRIPSLASHFHNHNPLKLSLNNDIYPISGLTDKRLKPQTHPPPTEEDEGNPQDQFRFWIPPAATWRHSPNLMAKIAERLGTDAVNVVDFDLHLYDTQRAVVGGMDNDLIFARGIDNLMMTYCSLSALTASVSDAGSLAEESSIRLLCCFDNEEISSSTAVGGHSNFLPNTLRRLSLLPVHSSVPNKKSGSLVSSVEDIWKASESSSRPPHPKTQSISDAALLERALSRSFLISADMMHAHHPLYPNYHENLQRPILNRGLVLYSSSTSSLTKNNLGHALLRELACRTTPVPPIDDPETSPPADTTATTTTPANSEGSSTTAPLATYEEYQSPPNFQYLTPRNDTSCGSSLGRVLAPLLGVRMVEVGNSQLSMHSIREVAGAEDIENAVRIFRGFWEGFGSMREEYGKWTFG